jgi:uncharacterized cupredoxin-like copper-binding protein
MADVQTSEVNVKLEPAKVGAWRVKFDNDGNYTIFV